MLEEFVRASLHEGADLGEILDGLLAAAGDMGLSAAEALDVIERVAQSVRASETAGVQLWYDGEKAATGIAMGSTLLQFRVRNAQARPIHSVAISVVQPLTGELIDCPVINILNKDGSKSTEVTMVLEQVGRHIVREGFVRVRPLAGATQHLRFDESILITAESVTAARTQIHSISQTIQTHGGGVVSADGISSLPSAGRVDHWLPVRLVPCAADDVDRARSRAAQPMAHRAPPEAPVNGAAALLDRRMVSAPLPREAPLAPTETAVEVIPTPPPRPQPPQRMEALHSPELPSRPTPPVAAGASLQQQLASAILARYPDGVIKKIDQDRFVDIHLPSIFPRRGSHLFFKTSRAGIRLGVYCRSVEFVDQVLKSTSTVEHWHWGMLPIGNPTFADPDDAIRTALEILEDIRAAVA